MRYGIRATDGAPRRPLGLAVSICFIGVLGCPAAGLPPQPADLLPRADGAGVLFRCYAPEARVVYLAGTFNGWARNVGGVVTNAAFAMQGPDERGLWRKRLELGMGSYRFKFNINGDGRAWYTPDSIYAPDPDRGAMVHVTAAGEVHTRSPLNEEWAPRVRDGRVEFQVFAPEAHVVYLAGSFNEWAENRDGLVTDPRFAMRGPDAEGLWHRTIRPAPGSYRYQFVIDGDRWIADPNGRAVSNNPRMSVVTVP